MEVSGISDILYSDYDILKVQSSIPKVRLDVLFFTGTEVAAVMRAESTGKPTPRLPGRPPATLGRR